MDLEQLLTNIDDAHTAAVADRDKAARSARQWQGDGRELSFSIESECHHAVAVALGRILGKDTPAPL